MPIIIAQYIMYRTASGTRPKFTTCMPFYALSMKAIITMCKSIISPSKLTLASHRSAV